jgi:MraZ protein
MVSQIVPRGVADAGSGFGAHERRVPPGRGPAQVGLGVDGSGGFLSNYTSRLDAKGRVSIPAPFRAVLARDGFEGLYVHPSLDVEAVDCGGHALLREIHDLLRPLSPYSEERDLFSTALIGTSEILKIDSEGRVTLSESAKAYAGIATEVTFVGHDFKFQIWEPGRFRVHLAEAKSRLHDFRKQLSARHVAPDSPPPRPHGARE